MKSALRAASIAVVLLVAACSAGSPAISPTVAPSSAPTAAAIVPSAAPVTVVDDAGRTVTFATPPVRIVSAAPSDTELAFALGLGDDVVAVDKYSDYPPEAKQKASIGSYIDPDLEAIVGAKPDLVLVTKVHLAKLVPALESQKIRALVLDAPNIEGVFTDLLLLGRVTGRTDQANALVDRLRARVAAVEEAVAGAAPLSVFYELDPTLYTAGPGTFIDDLIRRAGGTNIASGASTAYPQLSAEDVVAANPAVIILADEAAGVSPGAVRDRSGWGGVSAVKTGRIVVFDPDLGSRPGPRIVDALEQIARILHPDRF